MTRKSFKINYFRFSYFTFEKKSCWPLILKEFINFWVSSEIIQSIKEKLNEHDVYIEESSEIEYKEGEIFFIKTGQLKNQEAIFLSKKGKERKKKRWFLRSNSSIRRSNTSKASKGIRRKRGQNSGNSTFIHWNSRGQATF